LMHVIITVQASQQVDACAFASVNVLLFSFVLSLFLRLAPRCIQVLR
jgi:hypothetical protein